MYAHKQILLAKCFENDWALTKIPKIVKDEEELERVKQALKKNYKVMYVYKADERPINIIPHWSQVAGSSR